MTEEREVTEKDKEFAKKANDDIRWLSSICDRDQKPPMEELEQVVNTLGVLQVINPYLGKMTVEDRITMSIVGYIQQTARKADPERFSNISAYVYVQLAHQWVCEETDHDKEMEHYKGFMGRIGGA